MHHKLITGSPVAVPDAPVLSIDQIEDLPLETLLRALERMKLFFANMHNRFTQHNNLRITRMVKCLVVTHVTAKSAHSSEGHTRGDATMHHCSGTA